MDDRNALAPTAAPAECATIFCAIELSRKSWVVAVQSPGSEKVSLHQLAAGDAEALVALLKGRCAKAARALGRPVRVVSCYEAGYDGFWLHRVLQAQGVENHVIDPASVQVSRRARRAKTDRLDAHGLLRALSAWLRGEPQVCSMVRVPTVAEEDGKRLHRERRRLVKERTQHVNRIKGLLASRGIYGFQPRRRGAAAQLSALRTGDGRPLDGGLRDELARHFARLALVEEQVGALEAERDRVLVEPAPAGSAEAKIQSLVQLKSIGPETATILVREVFYRQYDNRRQLGSYLGLAPSPYDSGRMCREQGISKAGNAHARSALIELAWLWRRYQPASALSRWFEERVKGMNGRIKRISVVALARKLVVALWRYLELGLVPDGAVLKA